MKKNIEAVKRQIPWVILFFLLLGLHFLAETGLDDDAFFGSALADSTLPAFLAGRYNEWSSRVLIEAAVVWCASAAPWVWRLLDTLMILTLVWNITDLLGIRKRLQDALLFFVMLWTVPLISLSSAGWITTTMNYLWPLTLGIVAMRPASYWLGVKQPAKRYGVWEGILYSGCLLYAANMEQMGAILLGFYLVFGAVLLLEKKKLPLLYVLQFILLALSMVFVLAAPGNGVRNAVEAERFLPEHGALSAGQKLLLGFLETMHYYLAAGQDKSCFVFALLAGVLFVRAVRRGRGRKAGWIGSLLALCPLLFYWIIGQMSNWLLYGVNLTRGRNGIAVLSFNRELPGLGEYGASLVAFQTACYLVVIGCTIAVIGLLHGKSRETLLEWLILAAGFASRLLVGFSPTIYVSGDRTALFCSVAILIVAWRNLQLYFAEESKWYWKEGVFAYLGVCIAGALHIV